jgi:ankyrin repeat protein
MRILKTHMFFAMLFISMVAVGQKKNVFHDRTFWKGNPNLETVKEKITEGNDATALNENAFDAVIYALLEKVDDDVVKHLLSFEENAVDKKTHDSRIYLHWAAYAGQIEMVNYLLEKGSSVMALDSHGYTPLAFAANAGQKDNALYEAFEKHGVDLANEKNENGANVLLLVAPALTNEDELAFFTSKGLKLESTDNKGNGIFNYAAKKGNIDFLKLLVKKGVDYKSANKEGGNAILYASMGARGSEYSIETFKYLESLGIEPNVVGDYNRNPLHRIAYNSNDAALFEYFIDKAVDINLQDKGGDSPFMNVANSNTLEIVKLLLPKVTAINAQDENGRSALAMAVNRNKVEVVDFLLKNGADASVADSKGNTLAYYLLNTWNEEDPSEFDAKLSLLIDSGVPMTTSQHDKNTLLHLAAKENDLALVKRITEFEIPINTTNAEGYTALQIAAMKATDVAILKYLISKGASTKIKTDFEETVYDLASENELLQKQNTTLNFLK